MSENELVVPVCAAIALHLGIAREKVTSELTLGDDLALDSLDVLAVVDRAGVLLGRRLTLDYSTAERTDLLTRLSTLSIAEFADCVIPQ